MGARSDKRRGADRLAGEVCDTNEELRTMGTQWMESTAYEGATSIIITNKSNLIAFVELLKVGSKERATTALVMPGEAIRFPVAGNAVLGSVSTGETWCNRRVGWQDARTSMYRPALAAHADTIQFRGVIHEKGSGLTTMMVFEERPGKDIPRAFR